MTIRKRVCMIQVQSKSYRESCLPYPTNIVETVHVKLPLIANKRNEDLLTIIKVCHNINITTWKPIMFIETVLYLLYKICLYPFHHLSSS